MKSLKTTPTTAASAPSAARNTTGLFPTAIATAEITPISPIGTIATCRYPARAPFRFTSGRAL